MGINALFILDILRLKNFIRDITRKPGRLGLYILQFGGFFLLLIPVFLNRGKAFGLISTFKFSLLNTGLTAILLSMLLPSLYSSLKQPGIVFGQGDAGILLVSPIKERTVFLWYLVRASFKNIFIAILFSLYLPFLSTIMETKIYSNNMVFGYIGIFTFFLALSPLDFLIYSLSVRFNAKEKIKYLIYSILAVILGFALYFIYVKKSMSGILNYFGSNAWNYVPIVGPSKQLILSTFNGDTASNIVYIIIQIITIALLIFLSVYFATDYYEEAVSRTEFILSIKNHTNKGNFGTYDNKDYLKKKKKNVKVNFAPKGPWAFIWLKMLENKHDVGSIYFNYYNLILLIASIVIGYFLPKDDPTLIYTFAFVYVYIGWLTSFVSAISSELHKMYIYIIPGTGMQKLVAVNAVPIYKALITAILIIVPAGIVIKSGVLNILIAILFIVGFSSLMNFSTAFLNILLPTKEDLKAALPFLRLMAMVVVFIPIGAISIPIGVMTKSMILGIFTASLMMFLASGIFLLFADHAFEHLEQK